MFILITSFELINLRIVIKNLFFAFIRKNCIQIVFCLFSFLGFARRIFYSALFTLLYFIILVVAISFWWGTTKIKIEIYNSYVISLSVTYNGPWITTGTPVSTVNKIARHYIAEILLQIHLKIHFPTLPTLNERSNVMIFVQKHL